MEQFVIFFTLGFTGSTRRMLLVGLVLIGLIAWYILALTLCMVSSPNVGKEEHLRLPYPFHFGVDLPMVAMIGFCFIAFVLAVKTVADVSNI